VRDLPVVRRDARVRLTGRAAGGVVDSENPRSVATVPPSRVLVVTGSAGHGHVKAAKALAAALRARHAAMDVAEIDALEKMPRWFSAVYRSSYLAMVDRHPIVWRSVYESTDRSTPVIGHALTVLAGGGLARAIAAWEPDLVVCTHFLAPEVLAREARRGRSTVPVHVVVTDHDVHRSWWWPEVETYYVASDLVKARLAYCYGVPGDRIHVTGIPVAAAFGAKRDPVAVRARFGLDPGRPTVLFLSGGFASGRTEKSILGIWADRPDVQVIAVCGTNARMKRRVSALPRPEGGTLHVMGFVDDVPDLMSVADLVVAKSGGSTVSEAMAAGKPFVVSASIPGQEERNADAIVAAGAGVRAPTPEEVRWHVVRLLSRGDDLRATAQRAKAFGRPHAADDVADRVAERLGLSAVWAPPAHGARAAAPR
jgi:processive 1,2-diacylglycerol beta-glucosyltransferase